MTIQVIEVSGDQDKLQNYVYSIYILLDMGDSDAIPEGKRIIAAINRALRRKSVSDDDKEGLRELRDELKRKIKEISR